MRAIPFASKNRVHSLLTVMFILIFSLASCSQQPTYSPPPQAGPDVIIKTDQILPETPLFFTYRQGTKSINFFVIKIQGKVQSFLDACMTCYPKKKGYRSEDDTVVCRACDQRFSVHTLEKGIGGCYPIKLPGREKKGTYFISIAAIEAQADKF